MKLFGSTALGRRILMIQNVMLVAFRRTQCNALSRYVPLPPTSALHDDAHRTSTNYLRRFVGFETLVVAPPSKTIALVSLSASCEQNEVPCLRAGCLICHLKHCHLPRLPPTANIFLVFCIDPISHSNLPCNLTCFLWSVRRT